ncbi:MAG: hypothetical protein ABIF85_01245 [Nanoarchaeota archaeon]
MEKKANTNNVFDKISVADAHKRGTILKHKYKNVFDKLAKM